MGMTIDEDGSTRYVCLECGFSDDLSMGSELRASDLPPPSAAPPDWPPRTPFALSWSGGKDSALTLRTLRREGREPEALITTVTDTYDRISMHGVRRELLARQAGALGIPLVEVVIPPGCVNDVYEARMAEAFASAPLSGVEEVAFGDLFLEDVRAYREERLAAGGKRGLFPLWGRDTGELAREFIAAGFEAIIVCLDPRALDPSFAGRPYDEQLLADVAGCDLAVRVGRQRPGDAQHVRDGAHVDRHHAVQLREAGGARRAHQVLAGRAEVRVDAGVGKPVGARPVRVVERTAWCTPPGQLGR